MGEGDKREVVPCNDHDTGCKKLKQIIQSNPKEPVTEEDLSSFCESAFKSTVKFELSAAEDEPDECYDGVPAAVRRKGKMVRE
jgi:hypothetical protein